MLKPPYAPMEAVSSDDIPVGEDWVYEPKWDGFRCLAFRDSDRVYLQSKAGRALGRYFPDLTTILGKLSAKRFVLDGEIVIPVEGRFSFNELLMRIHPASSRVNKLAAESPAMFIIFDLLVDDRGASLAARPLTDRRAALERFARRFFGQHPHLRLSPQTTELKRAKTWFKKVGGNLDGVIAKRASLPYRSGERVGMLKVKLRRTADCVVGGFRYAEGKKVVGSLLLGLYDDSGKLHHVGFTSSFKHGERVEITKRIERFIAAPGFTGRAPGGPSRWSTRRSDQWRPLRPKFVVEVEYDHFTGDRFRHGTRLVRWRPDKSPRQCTLGQVAIRGGATLELLAAGPRKRKTRAS